jgi:hypothetical protein
MISRRRLLRRGLAGVPALFILSGCATLSRRRSDMAGPTSYRRVFLFSGHLIDTPDRPTPRFPADKEPVAAAAIAATLDSLGCGDADLGICGGASGGDLLFAEAVLARGARLLMLLPFDEQTFLSESVDVTGPAWRRRLHREGESAHRDWLRARRAGPLPAIRTPTSAGNAGCSTARSPAARRPAWSSSACGTVAAEAPVARNMVREVEQHGGRVLARHAHTESPVRNHDCAILRTVVQGCRQKANDGTGCATTPLVFDEAVLVTPTCD